MSVLDVFNQDAFSVLSLTDAINKEPFIPGRVGAVAGWDEQGVTTTTVMIEEVEGQLSIVNPTERGGPGTTFGKEKRTARTLKVPHYQIDDGFNADEVQGVRAFGQENVVRTLQDMVNSRNAQHARWRLDPTLEYQRLGAIKGVILNGDATELLDLFDAFGVTQEAEVDFDLDNASPAAGALRKKCTEVVRLIDRNLGGTMRRGIYALCSDQFWDDLIAHTEVRASYLAQQEASQLRNGVAWEVFNFGGITFENYRGAFANGDNFIADNKAHIFPVGTPGLFRTIYAPADYIETVNTVGLPRYARQYPNPNGKRIETEVQMNALNYCTRPKVLIKAKRT